MDMLHSKELHTGRDKDHLWWFLGVLLLAGILHMIARQTPWFVNTLLFCAEFALQAGLVLFWIQSIHYRLLPSRSRTYITAAAFLMIGYLMLRCVKYRFFGDDPTPATRYCWYLFYLPMLLIAVLFLMSCISLNRQAVQERRTIGKEGWLLLPTGLLAAGVLTNDLHHLAFRPLPDVALLVGDAGTYTHGPLFFAAYGWIALCVAGGTVFLLLASRRIQSRWRAAVPFVLLAFSFLLLQAEEWLELQFGWQHLFELPETSIFTMIAVWESCIRNRLMPYNEGYERFFDSMQFPVMITDHSFTPVHRSQGQFEASREQLAVSLEKPVYLTPDTRLAGKRIRGGYAFWAEDESALHRVNEQLAEANETLENENELIRAENDLKEQRARIDSRNRIYSTIAEQMFPYHERIHALLQEAAPGREAFRGQIAKVSVLNAYVKRRTNLLLLTEQQPQVSMRELALAIEESARYLKYIGVQASVETAAEVIWPGQTAVSLFDTYEALIERLSAHVSYIMISLNKAGLRLTADARTLPAELLRTLTEMESAPDGGQTAGRLLPVTASLDEGLLYLSVYAEKGGAA